MICLSKVHIYNFAGYKGVFEIAFEKGLTLVRGRNTWGEAGDSNAAGKTTIFNAICWALFGKTPSAAQKKEVINDDCTSTKVTVDIGDLIVTRAYSSEGEVLEFSHLGLIHSSVSSKKKNYKLTKAQEELEGYLGINYNIFCNTLFVGATSKTIKFLEAQPGQRAQLLEKLVQTEVFLQTAAEMKMDNAEHKLDVIEYEKKIAVYEDRKTELESDIEDLEAAIEDAEGTQEKKSAFIKKEKRRISRELKAAKEIINAEVPENMKELTDQRRRLSKELDEYKATLVESKHSLANLVALEPGGRCPTCSREVDEGVNESILDEMETYKEDIEGARIDIHNTKQHLEEIEGQMEAVRSASRAKVSAQNKIEQLRREVVLLKDQASAKEVNPMRQMLEEKEAILERNEDALKLNKKELKKTLRSIDYLDRGQKMMKSDIRNFLFDRIRDKLSDYVNAILEKTTEGIFRMEFPINTGKDEKFDIKIYIRGVERSVKTFSNGEKWRLRMSLVQAFRLLLMENVDTKYGFMLIDDPMGDLDESGFEMFHSTVVNDLTPQVIMTIPKDEKIDADHILTVSKDENKVEIQYEAA